MLEIFDTYGNKITITLTGIKTNSGLDDSLFTFTAPPGVEVYDMGQWRTAQINAEKTELMRNAGYVIPACRESFFKKWKDSGQAGMTSKQSFNYTTLTSWLSQKTKNTISYSSSFL